LLCIHRDPLASGPPRTTQLLRLKYIKDDRGM
jgi:hypothetical protein